MKNQNKFVLKLLIVMIVFSSIIATEILPMISEKNCKNRVFNKMQDKSNDVIRGIVGIIPKNEKAGLSSYNGIGSGVIFDKKDNTYYVVTDRHVLNAENSEFKIFTKDTDFSGQIIKADDNVSFEIPDEKYYNSLLDSKVEYISKTDDLAILSFKYEGNLTVLDFETNNLSKKDKIMVIGHPEGNKYQLTYGYIESGLKKVRGDKVIRHNAYMKQGNSGGVALTENMKIAGINISGKFTLLGYFKSGYMIPYDIVEDNIKTWKKQK